MKKILRYLGVLLLVAVIGGCLYLNSLLPIMA